MSGPGPMKVWSASEHAFNFLGAPLENGRGDDEFLSWEQKEPNFSFKAGVDGEGCRSENKNTYTEVKATFLQSSKCNDILSAALLLDTKTEGGAGIGPLLIEDGQGTTVFQATQAWVVGPPVQKRGKEVGTNEWTIGCYLPNRLDGGN